MVGTYTPENQDSGEIACLEFPRCEYETHFFGFKRREVVGCKKYCTNFNMLYKS